MWSLLLSQRARLHLLKLRLPHLLKLRLLKLRLPRLPKLRLPRLSKLRCLRNDSYPKDPAPFLIIDFKTS